MDYLMDYLKKAIINYKATEFLQMLSDYELRCLYEDVIEQPLIGENAICYDVIMTEITYRFQEASLAGKTR